MVVVRNSGGTKGVILIKDTNLWNNSGVLMSGMVTIVHNS